MGAFYQKSVENMYNMCMFNIKVVLNIVWKKTRLN